MECRQRACESGGQWSRRCRSGKTATTLAARRGAPPAAEFVVSKGFTRDSGMLATPVDGAMSLATGTWGSAARAPAWEVDRKASCRDLNYLISMPSQLFNASYCVPYENTKNDSVKKDKTATTSKPTTRAAALAPRSRPPPRRMRGGPPRGMARAEVRRCPRFTGGGATADRLGGRRPPIAANTSPASSSAGGQMVAWSRCCCCDGTWQPAAASAWAAAGRRRTTTEEQRATDEREDAVAGNIITRTGRTDSCR